MEVTVTEVNSKIPNKPPAEQLALPLHYADNVRALPRSPETADELRVIARTLGAPERRPAAR